MKEGSNLLIDILLILTTPLLDIDTAADRVKTSDNLIGSIERIVPAAKGNLDDISRLGSPGLAGYRHQENDNNTGKFSHNIQRIRLYGED